MFQMTAHSIPDGISFSDLQELMSNAKRETTTTLVEGKTPEEVGQICRDALQQMHEKCKSPVTQKVAALMILNSFIDWFEVISREHLAEGDMEGAFGAHSQHIRLLDLHKQLLNIEVAADDFTVGDDSDDEPMMGAGA